MKVNNSTDINKTNNYPSYKKTIDTKRTTTYGVEKPGPVLGQTQTCAGLIHLKEHQAPLYYWLSNVYQYSTKPLPKGKTATIVNWIKIKNIGHSWFCAFLLILTTFCEYVSKICYRKYPSVSSKIKWYAFYRIIPLLVEFLKTAYAS